MVLAVVVAVETGRVLQGSVKNYNRTQVFPKQSHRMDKKDKKDRLMEPLDAARKNHSDQNLENIVETCESEDGLDEAAATPANVPAIRTAKKNSILYKVPVNKMTSCS